MKKLNGILWGVALIVLGLFFSLSALDVIATDIFFTGWWTLFIIVPCLIGFITEKDKTAKDRSNSRRYTKHNAEKQQDNALCKDHL